MDNKGIHLHEVAFGFPQEALVLKGITLSIHPCEFVGIVGSNGSGKTTLARLLNANLLPTEGTVFVNSFLSSRLHGQQPIKRLVALIGSDPENQFVTSTVFDEIAFALQAQRLESQEIDRRVEEVLALFHLSSYRDMHPFFLSVGEQFQVLMAAAIALQPCYLVLDEISSMVDSHVRHEILEMLLGLRSRMDLGIIHLTHRLDDLLLADRIVVLQQGKVKKDGTVVEIFLQALVTPDWGIEIPLVYQIYRLLSPEKQPSFPELTRHIPEMLLERNR